MAMKPKAVTNEPSGPNRSLREWKMHTNMGSLFQEDIARIRAFRLAAEDLYRTFGTQVTQRLTVGKERILHSETTLRSAADSVRLTLLHKEKAYFDGVVASLRLLHDPSVNQRLDSIQADWQTISRGIIIFHGPAGEVTGRTILDAWLFGRVSHHNDDHRSVLEDLSDNEDLAVFALQAAFVGYARIILRLDALCAEILGEAPVWDRVSPGDEKFF